MERKQLKNIYQADYTGISSFNEKLNLNFEVDYFANFEIVHITNKYQKKEDELKGKMKISNVYETAHLGRRDKLCSRAVGTFTDTNSILNSGLKRILICGSPGTGKTTFCKKIVHDFYDKNCWKEFDDIIWLSLKHLKDDSFSNEDIDEEKLLEKYFSREMSSIMNQENILYILDGWDEIQDLLADPKKLKLAKVIGELKEKKNLILTSRPTVGLKFSDFDRVLEITGFNERNQRKYIDRVLEQTQFINQRDTILQYIDKSVFQDFAAIPFLLDIFLFSWQEISTFGLTEITLSKLYQAFIQKLAKKSSTHKDDATFSYIMTEVLPNEFKILLEMASSWLKNGAMEFSSQYSDKYSDSTINQDFLSNIIGNNGSSRCEFLHLTFLEFFAALELVNRNEIDFQTFVTENKYNPKYFVVFAFIAGIINENLHNLKGYWTKDNLQGYRYSKNEKLDLFFDYLEMDPVDLAGSYHYTLLANCIGECQISEQRKNDLWRDILSAVKNTVPYTNSKLVRGFRSLPLPSTKKIDLSLLKNLSYFPENSKCPQLTNDQIKMIISAENSNSSYTKLKVLSRQSNFSKYCTEEILKIINFDSLRYKTVFSHFPLPLFKKVLRQLRIQEIYGDAFSDVNPPTIKGISSADAKELCKTIADIQDEDSIQDIIYKLITKPNSLKVEESLFFLKRVYDFQNEVPLAVVKVFQENVISESILTRAIEILSFFGTNSTLITEHILQLATTIPNLKIKALHFLADNFQGKEIPTMVASKFKEELVHHFKCESERIEIREKLLKNSLADEKDPVLSQSGLTYFNFTRPQMNIKEFLDIVKARSGLYTFPYILEYFVDETGPALPSDLEDLHIFKVMPFILETKTQNGELNLKETIWNIIKSKDTPLSIIHGIFDQDLLFETVDALLKNLDYDNTKDFQWKPIIKRIISLVHEIQKVEHNYYKMSQKYRTSKIDDLCPKHEVLVNIPALEDLLNTTTKILTKERENYYKNLKESLIYICDERNPNCTIPLREKLANCGLSDSQYHEDVTDELLKFYNQNTNLELRLEILCLLSNRCLTKEQIYTFIRAQRSMSEGKVTEEKIKFPREYLINLSNKKSDALNSIYSYIKHFNDFTEEELVELRQDCEGLDDFCKEQESGDGEIQNRFEIFFESLRKITNLPETGELTLIVQEYLTKSEINQDQANKDFQAKMDNINPWKTYYNIEETCFLASKYIPEKDISAFIVAYLLTHSKIDFVHEFKCVFDKLTCWNIDQETFSRYFYEMLKNEEFGFYYLMLAEKICVEIPHLLGCVDKKSTKIQMDCISYLIAMSFTKLDENITFFVHYGNLYSSSSAHDKAIIAKLNPHQLECIHNAKQPIDHTTLNIRLLGIAPKIEWYKHNFSKLTLNDLDHKDFKNKVHVDLSFQKISKPEDVDKIKYFVKKHPIETLILSNNQITNYKLEILLRDITETHIKYLIVDNNSIDLKDVDLIDNFGKEKIFLGKQLLLLDLSGNRISQEWVQNMKKVEGVSESYRKNLQGDKIVKMLHVENCTIVYYREDTSYADRNCTIT